MKYQHRFRIHAPLDQVARFHSRSGSMGAITPPPIIVQVHRAPELLQGGDEMEFTMWLGPLPVRWLARIEDVTPGGFTDRQLRGPFAEWKHRHTYIALDEQATEVLDEVQAQLRPHPFWWLVGAGMWLGLPVLFSYRAWKTRRMMNEHAAG